MTKRERTTAQPKPHPAPRVDQILDHTARIAALEKAMLEMNADFNKLAKVVNSQAAEIARLKQQVGGATVAQQLTDTLRKARNEVRRWQSSNSHTIQVILVLMYSHLSVVIDFACLRPTMRGFTRQPDYIHHIRAQIAPFTITAMLHTGCLVHSSGVSRLRTRVAAGLYRLSSCDRYDTPMKRK